MDLAAVRRVRRAVADVGVEFVDEVNGTPPLGKIMLLAMIGVGVMAVLFSTKAEWLYEDPNWLPVTTLQWPRQMQYVLSYGLWWIGFGTPVGHHLLNLGLHACVSVLVGLIGGRLWGSRNAAWAAGVLCWLHPLAIPAIGYATAISEMLVALGAVGIVYLLLHGWTWRWMVPAGVVMVGTLLVKESAIGVLLIPALLLIVRPVKVGQSAAWLLLLGFLLVVLGADFSIRAIQHTRDAYPWLLWPLEMFQQTFLAGMFWVQAWLPFRIAFQYDWTPWPLGAMQMGGGAMVAVVVWLERKRIPIEAFAILWVPAMIGVRLLIPTSNFPERAPELLYAQQWYPALPGMIWLIVGVGRRLCEVCYPVPVLSEGDSL